VPRRSTDSQVGKQKADFGGEKINEENSEFLSATSEGNNVEELLTEAKEGKKESGETEGNKVEVLLAEEWRKERGSAKGKKRKVAQRSRGKEDRKCRCNKRPTAEPDHSQAAGPEVRGEACVVEEEMESETDSDCVSVTESQVYRGDLYKLEDIKNFLDKTFGKSVKVLEHFPDGDKFLKRVLAVQKAVGVESLDEKKRFHLKKYMMSLRKLMKRAKG